MPGDGLLDNKFKYLAPLPPLLIWYAKLDLFQFEKNLNVRYCLLRLDAAKATDT